MIHSNAEDWATRLLKSEPNLAEDPVAAELALISHYDQGGVRRWYKEFAISKQPQGSTCEGWLYSLKDKADRLRDWAPSLITSYDDVAAIAWDGFTNEEAHELKKQKLKVAQAVVTVTWKQVEKLAKRADCRTATYNPNTPNKRQISKRKSRKHIGNGEWKFLSHSAGTRIFQPRRGPQIYSETPVNLSSFYACHAYFYPCSRCGKFTIPVEAKTAKKLCRSLTCSYNCPDLRQAFQVCGADEKYCNRLCAYCGDHNSSSDTD